MTRVLVAASSPVVRAGLEALVSRDADLVVVGDGADGALLEQIEAYEPDVVVLELSPDDDPLAVAVEPGERPAVVLLAGPLDPATTADLVRGGVLGLVPREGSAEQIVAAVRGAAAGMATIHPSYVAPLATQAADEREGAAAPVAAAGVQTESFGTGSRLEGSGARDLTPRELEVLRMLAEGLANKQIAARLGISDHTVKFHVGAIFAKLRASSRTEAVMLGARRGLVML